MMFNFIINIEKNRKENFFDKVLPGRPGGINQPQGFRNRKSEVLIWNFGFGILEGERYVHGGKCFGANVYRWAVVRG
jgi:hypothetical protein